LVIELSNDALTITVLDPSADRDRFGTRYCTGGYIFQIADSRVGDLLTGPTYPNSFNVYDGQGIPDAFSRAPLRDPAQPDIALVPGIGICDLAANEVREFCTWDVEVDGFSVRMTASQSLEPYGFALERTVALRSRTVRSATRISNTGSAGFPVCWFPHPFFPQPDGTNDTGANELCQLNIPVAIADNPGYVMAPSGFIARRYWPWDEGHYLALDHDARNPLVIVQRHPKLGLVVGSTSYVPRFFPIWGNRNTFSWEPYFENTVAPNQTLSWWIDYTF